MKQIVASSVGRKLLMALSGLFLSLFLVVHLGGNLLLFKNDGGMAFNEYSEFMEHNPLVLFLEIILFAGFFIHILDGIWLTLRNKEARPVRYEVNQPQANSSWFSRNMGFTGALVFLFLGVHLRTFMIGQRFLHASASMYESVKTAFENPLYSGFYAVTIAFLGLHLNHGFQSTFQSLGLNHPEYNPWIKRIGLLFSVLVPAGFIAMPIYFLLRRFAG